MISMSKCSVAKDAPNDGGSVDGMNITQRGETLTTGSPSSPSSRVIGKAKPYRGLGDMFLYST
jgi:hypothetical protein